MNKKIRKLRAKIDEVNRRFAPKLTETPKPESSGRGAPAQEPIRLDDLRRKLKAQRGEENQLIGNMPIAHYQRGFERAPPTGANEAAAAWGVTLAEAAPGKEVLHPLRGPLYYGAIRLGEVEGCGHVDARFAEEIADPQSAIRMRIAQRCVMPDCAIEEIVFMDIETCGLGSAPLFLIGIMVWERDGFEVRQFLARDYAEEAAAVAFFLDDLCKRRLLVTFNGKSFDLPFIRMRAAALGIPFAAAPAHFDLLHESRRVWKKTLPDCKLQTLERHVCGRARLGDIPGAMIPDAYHAFVRTGNAWRIAEILKHNMLDLATLADVMMYLPAPPPPKKRAPRKRTPQIAHRRRPEGSR